MCKHSRDQECKCKSGTEYLCNVYMNIHYLHSVNNLPLYHISTLTRSIKSMEKPSSKTFRPVSLNTCRTRLTSMVNKCYISYLQHPLKHDSEAVLTNTKPCQWNPSAKEPLCTSPFNRFSLASFTKSTKKSLTQITIWRSLCEKRYLPPTLSSQMCQEYLHLLYL
jgi:hypothetical protein